MRKSLATIGFVAAFVSSSALAGPYTGQDIADGLSILGSIAGALGDMAQQANQQRFQEMADWADRCAQRDLQAVVNGVNTDGDVQNLELLVKNGDIARRVMRKCVGKELVDAGVGIKDVQDRIVIPSLNAWIAKRNALVEKQNGAQRAQSDPERTQVAATNNIELNCPAPVVLVGDPDPGKDPVVSVHVYRYGDAGDWYVTYRLSRGATVSRGNQYNMRSVPYGPTSYWVGTLKSDPTIVNAGAIFGPSVTGEYTYHETIRKDGQIIVEMEARQCVRVGNTPPMVATQRQQEEPADEDQKAKWERRVALEGQRSADDAYLKCLHDNTGTFALVSNEPAETVVKAAIGACFEARQTLTDASQKAGAGLDDQWFAGLHQALSNQPIAYVLEMRAAAALERAKNAPETKPDTDVKWK